MDDESQTENSAEITRRVARYDQPAVEDIEEGDYVRGAGEVGTIIEIDAPEDEYHPHRYRVEGDDGTLYVDERGKWRDESGNSSLVYGYRREYVSVTRSLEPLPDNIDPEASVETIKGIGPATRRKMGVSTIGELYHAMLEPSRRDGFGANAWDAMDWRVQDRVEELLGVTFSGSVEHGDEYGHHAPEEPPTTDDEWDGDTTGYDVDVETVEIESIDGGRETEISVTHAADDNPRDDRVESVEAAAELAEELIDERTEVEERNTWGGETEIVDVDPADPSEVATEVARQTVGAEHVVELGRQQEHEDAPLVELDVIVFDDARELIVRPTGVEVREPEEDTDTDDEQSTLADLTEPPRYGVDRDADPDHFDDGTELLTDGGGGGGGGLGGELRRPDEADEDTPSDD